MSGISIIIVNYNVKYFLRQCLQSIYKSDYIGDLEVIVVDNDSHDGSVGMIESEFPSVKVIANKENVGFSRANNQGITIVKNAFTLILNPDTILQEDTLRLCSEYLSAKNELGAIGVKMVDGSGTYLPESKRGFPTALNALFKMSGLSKLFPRSKFFNSYYLGHLDKGAINEIDVLTGAFIFANTEMLQNIGGFDDDYFMYGEDIELSYQIKEAGYKIAYFPMTQIIHFKGESTKKLTKSYIKNFYGAMSIYAGKRNTTTSFLWSWLLNLGIIFSAIISVAKKVFSQLIRPLLDVVIVFSSAKLIQKFWANYYYRDPDYYSSASFSWLYLFLVVFSVLCYYLFGQYDLRHNLKHLLYGFVLSTLATLSIYSLMPVELRFSRIILLLLAFLSPFILYITRKVYNLIFHGNFNFNIADGKRVAIVGNENSYSRIADIVNKFSGPQSLVGRINPNSTFSELGSVDNIKEIVESRNINEVVFCSSDMSTTDIFKSMTQVGDSVSVKLSNNDNTTILGSTSKERVGEWYALDFGFKITEPFHRRTKRLLDLLFCGIAILLFPLVFLLSGHSKLIYRNLFQVIAGRKSWLGYIANDNYVSDLPYLKKAVFSFGDEDQSSSKTIHQENLWYAKNYSTWTELSLLLQKFLKR